MLPAPNSTMERSRIGETLTGLSGPSEAELQRGRAAGTRVAWHACEATHEQCEPPHELMRNAAKLHARDFKNAWRHNSNLVHLSFFSPPLVFPPPCFSDRLITVPEHDFGLSHRPTPRHSSLRPTFKNRLIAGLPHHYPLND